jgi:putative hydrolase of the HAD superfamily
MRLNERASPSHNTVGLQVKDENSVASDRATITTIFFDAAGTLIFLPNSVGYHYAFVAERLGLRLAADAFDRAFAVCWNEMPARPAIDGPREADDKGWWRVLVNRVLDHVAPDMGELDRDAFFEAVYGHFAESGVWELYPEVAPVLEDLHGRFQLAVISNFDARLRMILEHLGVTKFFAHIFLSSELGVDKPDPEIYRRALRLSGARPNESLHIGDDPERDWKAAAAAGLSVFRLKRPANSLRDLASDIHCDQP